MGETEHEKLASVNSSIVKLKIRSLICSAEFNTSQGHKFCFKEDNVFVQEYLDATFCRSNNYAETSIYLKRITRDYSGKGFQINRN